MTFPETETTDVYELMDGLSELLNHTYWRLAVALGDIEEGQTEISVSMERILGRVEEELWRIRDLDNS